MNVQSRDVFSIVLAGGEGKRLSPLTLDRAKPAVPFGGNYRLIDFALSNLVNAGYLRIVVLTQYKSHSLDRHISTTWRLSPLLGNYVAPVPAQMRRGPHWFQGSADAIYQNLNLLRDERPKIVVVFGADHIYRMDPRQMVQQHIDSGAGVTVAGAARADATRPTSSGSSRPPRTAARSRPSARSPRTRRPRRSRPARSTRRWATTCSRPTRWSTPSRRTPRRASPRTTWAATSSRCSSSSRARRSTTSRDNEVPGATDRDRGYWRDVGTLDAFYDAHMDLISVHPVFNLYNMQWPILTLPEPLPPAKFVFEEEGRTGQALDSMVCAGVVVSGATVRKSILSPEVHLHSFAEVEESVLFPGVDVGRKAVLRRAILDKDVVVEPGAQVGVDLERDRERFTVSDSGIVVVPRARG